LLYLLLSILLNAYLFLSFKIVERFRIPVLQAIVFNYITCVVTGTLIIGSFPLNASAVGQPWFYWALLMGSMFISIFNLIGFTAQKIGVSVVSVVTKLSLVIPFLFSIYLYSEKVTALQIGGVVLALVAVVFTSVPDKKSNEGKQTLPPFVRLLIPLVLFFSTGLLDTLIKYVEQGFLNATNSDAYLITSFATAAFFGSLVLIVLLVRGKQLFNPWSILAGIAIGVPNYFSIWCLVKALQLFPGKSAAIIPVNNMGIVLAGSVAAFLLLGERMSRINWLGIGLSLIAIALIAFG
jgi:drug/metabolite transporter (DMT)-like permease